jgi:beta-lactam-binding protein with PASTA domain
MAGVAGKNWARPTDSDLIRGQEVDVPGVECLPIGAAEDRLRQAGFDVRVDDDPVDSDCPAGRAAGTNPSGETFEGDTVTILVSNGSGADDDDDNGGGDDDERPGPPGDGGGGGSPTPIPGPSIGPPRTDD